MLKDKLSKVKAQISVKTLKLVQTLILKLWVDCFYFNLSKYEIRVIKHNKPVALL